MTVVGVIFVLAMYFLPALIAAQKKHHNASAICLLNLFLGWTCIGWIAALVWSATSPPPTQLPPQYPPYYQHQLPPQYAQQQPPQQQVGPWNQG